MKQEKLGFGIILRIGMSLIPILFGMSTPAMIWCSFNIAMSFIVFGPLTSVVSSLCAICISMFFYGIYGAGAKLEGLFLAIQSILCAWACIYAIVRKKDFFTGVWLSAIGFLFPSLMSLRNAANNAGVSIAQLLTDIPIASFKEQYSLLIEEGSLQIDASQLETVFDFLREIIAAMTPSLIIIASVIIGYIVMWCINARLRNAAGLAFDHSFSNIRIPFTMLIITVVVFLISFFVQNENVRYLTLNIFSILFSLFFFAGLSLVEFFLRKAVKGKILRVAIHIGIIMLFASIITVGGYINIVTIYAFIAALDTFFNFRKFGEREEQYETEERKN